MFRFRVQHRATREQHCSFPNKFMCNNHSMFFLAHDVIQTFIRGESLMSTIHSHRALSNCNQRPHKWCQLEPVAVEESEINAKPTRRPQSYRSIEAPKDLGTGRDLRVWNTVWQLPIWLDTSDFFNYSDLFDCKNQLATSWPENSATLNPAHVMPWRLATPNRSTSIPIA